MDRKFGTLNEEDLEELLANKDSKSTKQQTKKAVRLLREFLISRTEDPNFENYSAEQLDNSLYNLVQCSKRNTAP